MTPPAAATAEPPLAHTLDYADALAAMTGLDRMLSNQKDWISEQIYNHGYLDATGASVPDEKYHTARVEFTDSRGKRYKVFVAKKANNGDDLLLWLTPPDGEKYAPQAIEVKRDARGYYLKYGDQNVYNAFFPYVHQGVPIQGYLEKRAQMAEDTLATDVGVLATGTGKSHVIGHIMKGLGGKGVVIVPDKLGDQMARDLQEVMPSQHISTIKAPSDGESPADIPTPTPNGVCVIEASAAIKLAKEDSNWLTNGPAKNIFIDEAHEFTMRLKEDLEPPGLACLKSIATHNHLLAITATPTKELYEALGVKEPVFSMTMYEAMHTLKDRPFRPLALEMRQVGTDKKDAEGTVDPQKVRESIYDEVLAGYFGRDEYITPDYCYEPGKQAVLRTDVERRYTSCNSQQGAMAGRHDAAPNPGQDHGDSFARSVVSAMQKNRVRYSAHKHVGFAINKDTLHQVSQSLQAIHNGTYDAEKLSALKQEVLKRRAQSAIAEYIRMYVREGHGHDLPIGVSNLLNEKNLGELQSVTDEQLHDANTQQRYKEAVRRIDPEDFRALMPELFERMIGTVDGINLQGEAQDAAKNVRQAHLRRAKAMKERGISEKEARRLDIEGQLPPEEITDTAPTYYAVCLQKTRGEVKAFYYKDGKEKELERITVDGKTLSVSETVAQLVRQGRIVHVMDNYELTTGFSDADMFMTTRVVEAVGDYVVRATQILGRPIRAKDGMAAVNEIVGPLIKLKGAPGIDRHFTCYDVVAQDFLARSETFINNWVDKGKAQWMSVASTLQSPATATPAGPAPAPEKGVA